MIKLFLTWLFMFFCVYLGIAFITWDLNPRDWEMAARFLLVLFAPAALVVAYAYNEEGKT